MNRKSFSRVLPFVALAAVAQGANAVELMVSIENISPANGTFLTPMWFGFHNGNFDMFNVGQVASAGIERIAEDGNAAVLRDEFLASSAGTVSGLLNGVGPIAPGQRTSRVVTVDENNAQSTYFSWASMIIPSNDAFVGNDNARQHRIFNEAGQFVGMDFIVLGSQVWDAGTEVNDEIPANTAFLGQMAPNTGVNENGVVGFHRGFNPGGTILSDPRFSSADFTQPNYQVARIKVEAVPEPATMGALAVGLAAFLRRKRK